jgi:hypothetical protein
VVEVVTHLLGECLDLRLDVGVVIRVIIARLDEVGAGGAAGAVVGAGVAADWQAARIVKAAPERKL